MDRFYSFVKTACRFRATTWLYTDKLEKRLIKDLGLDQNDRWLRNTLETFSHLVTFYHSYPVHNGLSDDGGEELGQNYMEVDVIQGRIHAIKKPLSEYKS
mgnify:FL=1